MSAATGGSGSTATSVASSGAIWWATVRARASTASARPRAVGVVRCAQVGGGVHEPQRTPPQERLLGGPGDGAQARWWCRRHRRRSDGLP